MEDGVRMFQRQSIDASALQNTMETAVSFQTPVPPIRVAVGIAFLQMMVSVNVIMWYCECYMWNCDSNCDFMKANTTGLQWLCISGRFLSFRNVRGVVSLVVVHCQLIFPWFNIIPCSTNWGLCWTAISTIFTSLLCWLLSIRCLVAICLCKSNETDIRLYHPSIIHQKM